MDNTEKIKLAEKNGWKLKHGFYIDNEELELEWDSSVYFTEEQFTEYKHPADFWQKDEHPGTIYINLDELIEEEGLEGL